MNLKQHVFVTEYLRNADHIMAYKIAYNSNSDFNTIESAANRLLRRPDIAKAISDTQTAIRRQVEQELKAELKHELLTIQKKRELLAQIATGEMYAEQNYKGKNCSQCTQFVKPTINQMLKAIDIDNKLAGHYSQKQNHEPTFPAKELDQTLEPVEIAIQADYQEPVQLAKKEEKVETHQNTTNHNNCVALSTPPKNGMGKSIPIPKHKDVATAVRQMVT